MVPSGPTRGNWITLGAAIATGTPGIVMQFGIVGAGVELGTVLFGVSILGAAFLLSWAAEVAQLDISQGLALAFLAFIAVLPEYAVDLIFAWKAGRQDGAAGALGDLCGVERCHDLAIANMTGANRLLIGLGWAVVVLVWWRRSGKTSVALPITRRTDLGSLVLATIWGFSIALRGRISLIDFVVLVAMFGVYVWHAAKEEQEHPDLIGPPVAIAALGVVQRRVFTVVLFIYAAGVILASAEPFAEGLVQIGERFDISSFLLVQWLAPLASEAPEMVIAILFVLRAKPHQGLGALVSSKVNQWTLLVGALPLVYAIARGSLHAMPLSERQVEEVILTAAQSLFACAVLASLSISRVEAAGLLFLFLAQFGFGSTTVRYGFAAAYVTLTVALLIKSKVSRDGMAAAIRHAVRKPGAPFPAD